MNLLFFYSYIYSINERGLLVNRQDKFKGDERSVVCLHVWGDFVHAFFVEKLNKAQSAMLREDRQC